MKSKIQIQGNGPSKNGGVGRVDLAKGGYGVNVDLGKWGVTHDSGGVDVVCGPGGPEAEGPKKDKKPKRAKKTPAVLRSAFCGSRFWVFCGSRFWVLGVSQLGKAGNSALRNAA